VTQLDESDLTFPMNVIQFLIFQPVLDERQNFSNTLYHDTALPRMAMPVLQINHEQNSDVLMNNVGNGPVPVIKLQKLVAENREIYMTQSDLVAAEARFSHWFRNMNKGRAATFIMSIIGAATSVLTLYLLYKYTNLNAMVTSYVMQAGRVKSQNPDEGSSHSKLPDMIIDALAQAIILMFVLVILRAIYKFARRSRWARRFIQRKGDRKSNGSRSDITIEFSDGEDTCLQYLASIAIHGSLIGDLQGDPETYPHILAHERNYINDILTIDWKDLDEIVMTDCDVLHLPEKLTIPFSEKGKLRKILKHPYTIRILITSDKLIWQVSHNSIASRHRQWMETPIVPVERNIIYKARGGLSPDINAERRRRDELTREWTYSEQTNGRETHSPPKNNREPAPAEETGEVFV
jgi:hypothetical protein